MIDLEKIRLTPVSREPFPHFVTEGVLGEAEIADVRSSFPEIASTGVYPLSQLTYGAGFARLIEAIRSSDLEKILEERLDVSLAGLPLMITVRGHCHKRDGRIHTDSHDKIVTCLLYLNEPNWAPAEGRLRLLRSGSDLDDVIAEVPPNGGTLVAFKRSDNSWHGHHPYEGPRRYVMFNWVRSDLALAKNLGRHHLSAGIKRWLPSLRQEA